MLVDDRTHFVSWISFFWIKSCLNQMLARARWKMTAGIYVYCIQKRCPTITCVCDTKINFTDKKKKKKRTRTEEKSRIMTDYREKKICCWQFKENAWLIKSRASTYDGTTLCTQRQSQKHFNGLLTRSPLPILFLLFTPAASVPREWRQWGGAALSVRQLWFPITRFNKAKIGADRSAFVFLESCSQAANTDHPHMYV